MRWVFLFLVSALFATEGTLFLLNDSPFTLTAIVQAADGTMLGQEVLQPGEQKNMVTKLNPANLNLPNNYNVAITPYVVIWKCPNGGYYSVCSQVSPGSFIRSSICQGSYYCQPKEKQKKGSSDGSCRCCPCPDGE